MKIITRSLFPLLLAAAPLSAVASGFALTEQNGNGLGNAYAGQAASAQDASTIFFNPAGMTLLPDRQLVLGVNAIRPSIKFSGGATINGIGIPVAGSQGGDAGSWNLTGNVYYAWRASTNLRLGVGLGSPFGLKTDYSPNWVGRYQAIKSELRTVALNPALAWKVNDQLSLGAGLSVEWIDAELSNKIFTGSSAEPMATVKGSDVSLGYNLGALWQLSSATRLGLAYRSKIHHRLDGNLTVESPLSGLSGPAQAEITLPDTASLSLFHRLDARWDLLADVTWTGWSGFKTLTVTYANGAPISSTPENWRDTWRYSVGANYHWSPALTLRIGTAYDQAPVPDAYRTPRIPDNDRVWAAAGLQYRFSPADAADLGYAHLFVKNTPINNAAGNTLLTGSYRNAVDILSVQYMHNF